MIMPQICVKSEAGSVKSGAGSAKTRQEVQKYEKKCKTGALNKKFLI